MKKAFLFAAAVAIGFLACQKTELAVDNNLPVMKSKGQEITDQDNYLYKKKFAIALNDAMYKSEPLRKFIRDKALEKFDSDFDVLYNYVSENVIDGTGLTFRQLLAQSFKNPADLDEIAQAVPLLTIFVPTLPNNSFSAEIWNIEKEVPLVAVKVRGCSEVAIFTRNDTIAFKVKGNIIPGFPIVVIKDNERVVLPDNPKYERLLSQEGTINFYDEDGNLHSVSYTPPIYRGGPHGDFPFIIPVEFDWTTFKTLPYYAAFDSPTEYWEAVAGGKEVKEAWERVGLNNSEAWQRDYIYYGIDGQITNNGRYIDKYHETLTDFRIENTNGWAAVGQIADIAGSNNLNDPTLPGYCYSYSADTQPSAADFWTEGDFDFGVNIVMFDKTKAAASIAQTPLEKGFNASWNDLFDIKYDYLKEQEVIVGYKSNESLRIGLMFLIGPFSWLINDEPIYETQYWYQVTEVKTKEYKINYPVSVSTPWRLEDFANSILITIEETDYATEITEAYSGAVKYNTNFTENYENTSGSTKIGGSTGSSIEQTMSASASLKYTLNSNKLGSTDVYFSNPVIKGRTNSNYIFEWYSLRGVGIIFRPTTE
ncbi:MAG: hypothetical protein LBN95_09650 [Prevotellaceae bacterium]|jgi:hypothetical protein|nr:hypothetical protein [Prevotellaceae bacterium]